jgi:hypothetical protein
MDNSNLTVGEIDMGKAEDGSPIAKPYVPNQAILPGVEDALSTNESSN